MANEIIRARLQTPQDDEGHRKDIMVITDATSVIVDGEEPGTTKTLSEEIHDMKEDIAEASGTARSAGGIYLSRLEPDDGNSHLWGEIVTDYATADYTWVITETASGDDSLLIVSDSIDPVDFNPNTMIKITELMDYSSSIVASVGQYATKSVRT